MCHIDIPWPLTHERCENKIKYFLFGYTIHYPSEHAVQNLYAGTNIYNIFCTTTLWLSGHQKIPFWSLKSFDRELGTGM